MNTRNVTITSKNQITLPTEYVKTLHLSRSRVLEAEMQGGRIILTPQPAISDTMKKFWGKHSVKRPLADDEIKQAIRARSAEIAAKE